MVGSGISLTSTSSHYTLPTYGSPRVQVSSVNSLYGDPDLLIKEYFYSSPEQRAKSRTALAQRLSSSRSMLAILGWANLATIKDAYDGAVDLLAECQTIQLLIDTSNYLLTSTSFGVRDSHHLDLYERSWEILIKGIGCAYRLQPQARFRLLQHISLSLLPILNRRSIKAVLLDALAILFADEVDKDRVKAYIRSFEQDRDEYIRNYAKESLAELV